LAKKLMQVETLDAEEFEALFEGVPGVPPRPIPPAPKPESTPPGPAAPATDEPRPKFPLPRPAPA